MSTFNFRTASDLQDSYKDNIECSVISLHSVSYCYHITALCRVTVVLGFCMCFVV